MDNVIITPEYSEHAYIYHYVGVTPPHYLINVDHVTTGNKATSAMVHVYAFNAHGGIVREVYTLDQFKRLFTEREPSNQ